MVKYGESRCLASAVVTRAVEDWKKHKWLFHISQQTERNREIWATARRNGFQCPRDELLAFFRSAWFEVLLSGVTELEPKRARKELGIDESE